MTTDPIRAKIIELVPELGIKCDCDHCKIHRPLDMPATQVRPITFTDVLRAVISRFGTGKSKDEEWSIETQVAMGFPALMQMWNHAEHYDNQDQPTKDLIGKIIGVTD